MRRPTAKLAVGVALPAVVLFSALVTLGRIGVPDPTGPAGGLTLAMLVSGILSFLAYGALFGSSDNLFLRQLGVRGDAFLRERGVRLAGIGAAAVVGLTIPYLVGGQAAGPAFHVGLSAAAATVGVAVLAYAWAGSVMARGGGGALGIGIRPWDPGLARAAPLVYAPLLPFLGGSAAGAFTGAAVVHPAVVSLTALLVGVAGVWLGARIFDPAAGRFLPQAVEMAYAPPPEKGGEAFRVGRGLSALLPRPAAAVWVRDAAVGTRRFGWAARVTWPVAVVSIVALARWGDIPATHVWVVAAVGLALVIQSAAVVGLGVLERHGPRWIDRSTGVSVAQRFLGRWAWSWGLSLWLLVPVALAWGWWSGRGAAWAWPLAGAFAATVSTAASLLNSERR